MLKSTPAVSYLLVMFLLLIIPTSFLLAYDSQYAHPQLAQWAISAWNSQGDRYLNNQEAYYILEGAMQEDYPEWRSLNHFYNPKTKGGLKLFDAPLGRPSDEWSAEQGEWVFGQDYSWEKAIKAYRAGDKPTAFKALGGLLHLIADAGVPAHVRNSSHAFGDPYEQWVKESFKSGAIKSDWHPSTIAAFKDYGACLKSMAQFTNENFFDSDHLDDAVFDLPYAAVENAGEGYVSYNGHLAAGKNDQGLFLDDRVHLNYWLNLAPEIINREAAALKLFFQAVNEPKVKPQVLGVKLIGEGLKITAQEPTDWQPPVIDASANIPPQFIALEAPYFFAFSGSEPPRPVDNSTPKDSAETAEPVVPTEEISNEPLPEDPVTPENPETPEIPQTPPTDLPERFGGLSDGLVHLWHFNETEGDQLIDAVGNGNLWFYADRAVGRWGNGVNQGSLNERQIIGANLPPIEPSEITLALWFRDVADWEAGFTSRNRVYLGNSQDQPQAGLAPTVFYIDYFRQGLRDSFVSASPLDHNWHQLAAVFGRTSLDLYLDGALRESIAGNFAPETALSRFSIVGENGPSEFDEIAVWNRRLPAEAIAAWYSSGLELAP